MQTLRLVGLVGAVGLLSLVTSMWAGEEKDKSEENGWTTEFLVEKDELTHTGRNPWFVLEPREKEYKHDAPGIGLIQDGSLKLVKYGRGDKGGK